MSIQQALELLRESYRKTKEVYDGGAETRGVYLSQFIFNFTTYDDEMDELFVKKALEVCAAISEMGRRIDFMKDPEDYKWYLIMVNMPFFSDKIEWGTSVRCAWWTSDPGKIVLTTNGVWIDGDTPQKIRFTRPDWEDFIRAMQLFAKETTDGQ